MSIVPTDMVIPFDITVGFRKKVANALNMAFKDLPESDLDFVIQMVLPNLKVDFVIVDTITGEDVMISDYISDKIPEEYFIKNNTAPDDISRLEVRTNNLPIELEIVADQE